MLRQLLDDKVLCTLEKPFEWKTVEDLTVLSSVNMNDYHSSDSDVLSPRLLVGSLCMFFPHCCWKADCYISDIVCAPQ